MIHYQKGLLPNSEWIGRSGSRVSLYSHTTHRTRISEKGTQYSSVWVMYSGRIDRARLERYQWSDPAAIKIPALLEGFTPRINDTDKKVFKAKKMMADLHGIGATADVYNLLMEVEL